MKAFLLVLFVFCVYFKSTKAYPQNVSQIDAFYSSMERITDSSNEYFGSIALKIRLISKDVNYTSASCFNSIAAIFESGYHYEWSAKSRSF